MVQTLVAAPEAPPSLPRRRPAPSAARRRAFLAMVAVLPLHTVFLSAWVSWKPFVALIAVLVVWDAAAGWRERTWPWHRPASAAAAVFLAAMLASWPGPEYVSRFASLWLALAVGAAVMLVTERSLRPEGMSRSLLQTVYWSGAAMAATAVAFTPLALGTFGRGAADAVAGLPGVWRVAKPVYLESGFVALTNWHHEPGYAAAWMMLWLALGLVAGWLGAGSERRWVDAAVAGGLAFGVVMTFSRTGWVALVAALLVTAALAVRAGAVRRREAAATLARAALVVLLLVAAAFALDRPGVGGELADQFSFRFQQQAVLATDGAPEQPGVVPNDRAGAWPEYWEAFTAHPVRGIGLGTGWETPGLQEPHNLVLQLLGETGLVGLAGFAVLAGVLLNRGGGPLGRIALVVALLPAAFLTVLFEPTWWFAAGILLAGGAARRRPRAPDPYRAMAGAGV